MIVSYVIVSHVVDKQLANGTPQTSSTVDWILHKQGSSSPHL